MACRTPEPLALEIIGKHVDRIVEVTDDEIAAAIRMIYECTHNVAEGAGAARRRRDPGTRTDRAPQGRPSHP